MGSDYVLVAFTDYRIAFPVTDPGFTVNDSWAVINAAEVGNAAPAILFPTLTTFFLATKVLVKSNLHKCEGKSIRG